MLWLGANVMLEYDINDAKELLGNNKQNAIKSLEDVREQMGMKTFFSETTDSKVFSKIWFFQFFFPNFIFFLIS